MRTLRLVALSDDGKSLILAAADSSDPNDEGERFVLPVDDRVRAAARGDTRRLGQMDVDLGTNLPPRIIQARIRAGETPEQVAHSSGVRVERIMRFAHPVLQERARLAEQAREARVRLSDGAPTTPLQPFMAERLHLLGTDLDTVRWDAHRSEDGTWQVTATWQAGAKSGVTRWVYDIPARTVTPVDAPTTDFAEGTRLVRVVPSVPGERSSLPTYRGRVAALSPGDDTPGAPTAADRERGDEQTRNVVPVDGSPARDSRAGVVPDDVAEHDTIVLGRPDGDGEAEDPRARIPAWEDIVFGVRRHR